MMSKQTECIFNINKYRLIPERYVATSTLLILTSLDHFSAD